MHNNTNNNNNNNNSINNNNNNNNSINNNNSNNNNNNNNNSCLQPCDHLLCRPDKHVHAVDRDESNEDHPKNPTNQAGIAVEVIVNDDNS